MNQLKLETNPRSGRLTVKSRESLARVTGGFSNPGKMPGRAWSISAKRCHVGSELRKIAGTVCSDCFALKNNYRFGPVQAALARRLAAFERDSERWMEAIIIAIDDLALHTKNGKWFRWFDSGDLQSVRMLEILVEIARRLPHVNFWLPTREYKQRKDGTPPIVQSYCEKHGTEWPSNFTVRLSGHFHDMAGPSRIARELNCVISEVVTGGGFDCPSSRQGNHCGECRRCWSKEEFKVIYRKH
jgi:Gene product 88